jgi:hypothetical protein
MSDQKKDHEMGKAAKGHGEQGDGDSLSPEIRRLIFSYQEAGSERTWEPDAFTRRSETPTRPRAA